MSKLIALIIGAWVMYCSMIGSYDGAIVILALYILAIVLNPFDLKHKKDTTAANSRAHE